MELRVKEICKQKGITLQQLANKLGINRVNLSVSINGNPTLNKMSEIAEALGVSVNDLLPAPPKTVTGFLEVEGKVIKVNGVEDLKKIISELEKM